MAKVLFLALALATIIVAFGESSLERCQSKIPVEQLNHCHMHLTEGTSLNYKIWMKTDIAQQPKQQQYLQACCNQLKDVEQQCQCDAIQQVFDEARQQGTGVVQMRQMLRKAQNLPRDCELDVEKCPLVAPRVR